MYDEILVPLDASAVSEAILPYAAELAKRCDAHVTLFRVVESIGQAMATIAPTEPMMVTAPAVEAVMEGVEGEEDAATSYLKTAAERLHGQGLRVDWAVGRGSAGDEIIRYATEKSIDLIAMSSHGRSGLSRAILGSVADHVIRNAAVPVLILPYREPAK